MKEAIGRQRNVKAKQNSDTVIPADILDEVGKINVYVLGRRVMGPGLGGAWPKPKRRGRA